MIHSLAFASCSDAGTLAQVPAHRTDTMDLLPSFIARQRLEVVCGEESGLKSAGQEQLICWRLR